MRLRDKVALITGGAGGIGGATARIMAREGARVIITDVQDGATLASEIGAQFLKHNVASEAEWQATVSFAIEQLGGIDVLVNTAGIEGNLADSSPLCSLEEWRRVMSVNLEGTFLGCKAALPHMMEKGTGSIINVSSMALYLGSPIAVPYGVSKAAVWRYSRSVAAYVAAQGTRIRCNTIHPGMIRTPMHDQIVSSLAEITQTDLQTSSDALLDVVPFGERAEPEEVAHLICFLASDEASYITGSEFKVDGGWSLWSGR